MRNIATSKAAKTLFVIALMIVATLAVSGQLTTPSRIIFGDDEGEYQFNPSDPSAEELPTHEFYAGGNNILSVSDGLLDMSGMTENPQIVMKNNPDEGRGSFSFANWWDGEGKFGYHMTIPDGEGEERNLYTFWYNKEETGPQRRMDINLDSSKNEKFSLNVDDAGAQITYGSSIPEWMTRLPDITPGKQPKFRMRTDSISYDGFAGQGTNLDEGTPFHFVVEPEGMHYSVEEMSIFGIDSGGALNLRDSSGNMLFWVLEDPDGALQIQSETNGLSLQLEDIDFGFSDGLLDLSKMNEPTEVRLKRFESMPTSGELFHDGIALVKHEGKPYLVWNFEGTLLEVEFTNLVP